jgi:hypothetical protein
MTKELKHHEFKAELIEDEHGQAVMIEQSDGWGSDGPQTVILHPYQLRDICISLEILAADRNSENEIRSLKRRIAFLKNRLVDLKESACSGDAPGREAVLISALADIANEWCIDLIPEAANENTSRKTRRSAMGAKNHVEDS